MDTRKAGATLSSGRGVSRDRETVRRRATPAWVSFGFAIGCLLATGAAATGQDTSNSTAPAGAAGKPTPQAASPSPRPSSPSPGDPLHERIDRLIEAQLAKDLPGRSPAAPASDAEFLRRAFLDLSGVIPTADEARAFLDDPSPYKRSRLIDRLLESRSYARRMQQVFDVMLMERRPEAYGSAAPWREFLFQAFAENRPYDVLVQQILQPDGSDPKTRPAARFLLERDADPHTMTRDVGRLFLGMDIQCCQCHDHPLIDDYKQQHYYGLYAFFSRTVVIGGKNACGVIAPGSIPVVGEKAEGEVTFASVFKKKVTHKTGPRVLDAKPLPEPTVEKGRDYLIPPDKDGKVRPVPVYSRRERLGEALTSVDDPAFARNIANRLWALMMGRGVVHPLDLIHSDNPPSNPELLDLLAAEIAAMKYDVKAFLRELALTRAYQRSSEPPPDSSPELAEPNRFVVFAVRPTSPEQMAWSVMEAVGFTGAVRREVEHQLDGADPRMKAILSLDAERKALREAEIESTVHARLAPNIGSFVSHFGGVAGQAQEAAEATLTVDQALFVTNGEPLRGWLDPTRGWLVGRCGNLADASAVAEELYLSILSRRPASEERAEVAAYLASRNDPKERPAAVRELAWALMASTEFRFNH
jgi:Protein of unknown function (DUF1549)/Protein of unknown function (DUF1553)